MNLTLNQAEDLARAINLGNIDSETKIILCPSFVYLYPLAALLKDSNISLAAQNCADRENGAFTGEVSAAMLHSMNISYVLIGHSERRQYYHESHEIVKTKINIALDAGVKPIFCCGETKEIRINEVQDRYVLKQLEESLFHLSEDQIMSVIIAYEPVWAIGTGLTASAQQAQDMHQFIRLQIAYKYGSKVADQISILYGGSVNAANAKELFLQPDVDGGLVGGASLKAHDFITIMNS